MVVRLDRRRFLALAGAALSAAPFHALACRAVDTEGRAAGDPTTPATGYGPLAPVRDETTGLPLLDLPAGFRYVSFGWAGDPLVDGVPTPGLHDGMAAFAAGGGRIHLVRNHEVRIGSAFTDHPVYDANAGGGTTTIVFDPATGAAGDAWASLAGTAVNCAGGPTPWRSWLSCEETVLGPGGDNRYHHPHGYVFEVPADGTATAEPFRAMGRFVHEAVAVDPETGVVYETEDRAAAGLYRFRPDEPGTLAAGGRLDMLAIADTHGADTRTDQTVGVWRPVAWVPIDDPDPDGGGVDAVYRQGAAGGGATFARLEGAWHADGRIYIVSTNGGDVAAGQVWEYEPARERLRLLYESPGSHVLEMPDNICVSPRGGIVLCEDGTGVQFVNGLSPAGETFRFARNTAVLDRQHNGLRGDYTGSEFAGCVFSPDGEWLFVNIQRPGLTLAVTGPWDRGPL